MKNKMMSPRTLPSHANDDKIYPLPTIFVKRQSLINHSWINLENAQANGYIITISKANAIAEKNSLYNSACNFIPNRQVV